MAAIVMAAAVPVAMGNTTVQILHASDLEGGVDAIGNAPIFAAIMDHLEDEYPNTIILSAGDNYIPGPFFLASADYSMREILRSVLGQPDAREGVGRIDISIMNIVGFDASALGNHEFDPGTNTIKNIIGTDIRNGTQARWLGAQFPYLSANLNFDNDANLSGLFTGYVLDNTAFRSELSDLEQAATAPKIAASATISRGGETIGVVGATTPILEQISSPGDTKVKNPGAGTNNMEDLASIIQPYINSLVNSGINKIILVSHLQQIALEQELITKLHDVDIVIAGGSDTLLADSGDVLRPGDTAAGDYPIHTSNADGDPAIVVSTDGQYTYVGRLVVEFDDDGKIIPGSVDPDVSGAFATIEAVMNSLWGSDDPFAEGAKGNLVKQLTDAVEDVVIAKDSNTFGKTDVYLNGRRADVRTQETNLGDFTADANLAMARSYDATVVASLKNGGGIRESIGAIIEVSPDMYEEAPPQANPLSGKEEGEISQLDIENSLKFNNGLTLLTLTARQLREIIEHGVAASEPGQTPGRFPQVSGMAFSFDMNRTPGDRVCSLATKDEAGHITDMVVQDGQLMEDPNRTFRIVTLNFLANGGDGYPFPINAAANRLDLVDVMTEPGAAIFSDPGSEQDAMAEFLAVNYAETSYNQADVGPDRDERIQNLSERRDTVLTPVPANTIELTLLGRYESEIFDESAAEIVAHDPGTQRLFVVNGDANAIDVLSMRDPEHPAKVFEIPLGAYGESPTSVAVHDGLVAAAVESDPAQDPGKVLFFDINGTFLKSITVGALPDMLTFTPDGTKVLVANEGEPNDAYTVDPEGSVSIIDISGGVDSATVTTTGFGAFNGQAEVLKAAGVRIFGPGAAVAQDLEPEYIAVSKDSQKAWIALQENNAVAVLDLTTGQVTDILPLGFKDQSLPGNGLDASNKDEVINIATYANLFGMYQPDAIAAFEAFGKKYLITANEGDARDYDGFSEEERVKKLALDPEAFPNSSGIQQDEVLGRLKVTNTLGDRDEDGDFDALYAYGARSFSIFRQTLSGLELVFDSGDQFQQITAAVLPEDFNSDNDKNGSFDSRSDDKGPEPEGVTTGIINGHTFAFVGLERIGGIMVYDVTTPAAPKFVQYVNSRNFSGDPASDTAGDLGPEGLIFIPETESPNGKPLLVVAYEVSGSTSIYEINADDLLPAGDLDGDGDVDRDDISIIKAHRGQPASTCPKCDIDEDGIITVLDARKLVRMCTCPRCLCD